MKSVYQKVKGEMREIFGRIKNDNKNEIHISFRFTRQKIKKIKVEEINHRSLIKKKRERKILLYI